ncbi:RraA family protein [Gordonia sp. ABSL11-1]|uniref:RraA family protein n=1 Tax=Gordonia sp. ABSL11-1 TaxID=3053924 RepID=UPI0025738EF5|nr:RraA family protein [Gordonia sp. ABSL11-1]MDL9948146.1 RraA family protein [Gordonia sp. ABSL11-1]
MSHRIYTRIPACDPTLLDAIGKSSVADLHEAMDTMPGRAALLDPSIRALNRGITVVGQAITVNTFPGDGLAGHRALRLTGPGRVLVITSPGDPNTPLFAELVSLAASELGTEGVIADGPIRDSDALVQSRFPVWCRGTYAGRPLKRGPGEVNLPIVCGGVYIEPGDIIVADGDGVLRIPLAAAAATLDGAQRRAERENRIREAIAGGASLFELSGLSQALSAADIVEIDSTWNASTDSERSTR